LFDDVLYFLFAGPLSSVWKEWIKWCIEFGIEANAIIAVPYDWRLSPSMLEERDLYFHKLKYVYYIFAYDSLNVCLVMQLQELILSELIL